MPKQTDAVLSFIILNLLIWAAVVMELEWAGNIFMFITGLFLSNSICSIISNKAKKDRLESYLNGEHLHPIADKILYLYVIFIPVAFGWFFTGALWVVIVAIDSYIRDQATNKKESNGDT